MKRLIILSVFVLLHTIISAAPSLMNAQGQLTNSNGDTLTTGEYSITFSIYDAESSGIIIWTETNTKVEVFGGSFNVLLGSINPLHDSIFAGDNRWLGIAVGGEAEMTPRSRLVSVAFSQRTSTVDGTSGGSINGDVLIDGKLGIGTSNPDGQLELHTGTNNVALVISQNFIDRHKWRFLINDRGDGLDLDITASNHADNQHTMLTMSPPGTGRPTFRLLNDWLVVSNGNIGIGDSDPQSQLHLRGGSGHQMQVKLTANIDLPELRFSRWHGGTDVFTNTRIGVADHSGGGGFDLAFSVGNGSTDETVERMRISYNGNVGIGTTFPTTMLDVDGTTKTKILEITGGADLAEPFEITDDKNLQPGMVVVIDEKNPGKLRLCSDPYDTRVAGVISGAGGVQPGLTLKQDGVMEGSHNVALTGRVYVKASCFNGVIHPGDLLTTSSLPGYAMKASDINRRGGAVIGKAMSILEKDTGLVLVLVNLQ